MRATFALLGIIAALAPSFAGAGVISPAPRPPHSSPPAGQRLALMCFKTGEQQSGMNKICYYNCAGSEAAITVGAAQLCPISINR